MGLMGGITAGSTDKAEVRERDGVEALTTPRATAGCILPAWLAVVGVAHASCSEPTADESAIIRLACLAIVGVAHAS